MKIAKILAILLLSIVAFDNVHGMEESQKSLNEQVFTNKGNAGFSGNWYKSRFTPPNETSRKVLYEGQILGPEEEPNQMIERVVSAIAGAEELYENLQCKNMLSTADFAEQLGKLMDDGVVVFSTPILTNAGRFVERPLSACVMPPVDLNGELSKIKEIVDQYHQDGMGTGFYLSEAKDPISMLKYLNYIAIQGAQSKTEQRPVGNMAILDVYSPYIEEFVNVKVGADARGEEWKFNISINLTDEFMNAAQQNEKFQLSNGKMVEAKKLLEQIAIAAHQCGDPGLISLTRLNKDNATPHMSPYKCTAPCAEVGLAPGETCIFGYINLARLVNDKENPSLDFERLKEVVKLLTRALDNALEISIEQYSIEQSKDIMKAKRKIGIGICGFADLLIALNLSYCQEEARYLLQDILNVISYYSKEESIELAKYRGSFLAIGQSRYMDESFIVDKYGKLDTPHVSAKEWIDLAKNIKQSKLLRNATTTSLPPTGRSALVIGASTGIEPLFSLKTQDGIYEAFNMFLKKCIPYSEHAVLIEEIKAKGYFSKSVNIEHPFLTATEISPTDHLEMAIIAQTAIDESISKTINLPENTTPEEIMEIYCQAYNAGLKGISIFRNNSRSFQPKELSRTESK